MRRFFSEPSRKGRLANASKEPTRVKTPGPLQAGTHTKVVAERLGHSSTTLTMDVYSHVAPGMQSEATEQLEIMLYG